MDKTITEMLRGAGFGHRRLANTTNTGKHEVYDIRTGKVIGEFTALDSLRAMRRECARAHFRVVPVRDSEDFPLYEVRDQDNALIDVDAKRADAQELADAMNAIAREYAAQEGNQ